MLDAVCVGATVRVRGLLLLAGALHFSLWWCAAAAEAPSTAPSTAAPHGGDVAETKATEATSGKEPFVLTEFRRQLQDPLIPIQVAAIRSLTELIRRTKERTAQGLLIELREAADQLQTCDCDDGLLRGKTSISVVAGCELLVRHVTRTSKFDHSVRVPRSERCAWCGGVAFSHPGSPSCGVACLSRCRTTKPSRTCL